MDEEDGLLRLLEESINSDDGYDGADVKEKTVPLKTDNLKDQIGEHDSLKYRLLGPSLTKAGQDSVDQQKASFKYPFQYSRLTFARSPRSYTTPRKDQGSSTMRKSKIRS